jgi:hypothetical protein
LLGQWHHETPEGRAMADRSGLGFIGLMFGAATFAVMVIGTVVVVIT